MARVRYHDFRQEDSTKLFNDRYRGMFLSGVYSGFNVSPGGSGGLNLKFTHDSDPDNTGAVLGKIHTPDGVQIEENANQDDVVIGSLSAGTPNIHYVVASYQYNAALPNNDVVYAVKQGTSGSPPTPPSLTDDEVLLAIIDVPSGATAYTDAGVDIKTVAKRNLFGGELEVSKELVDILKPGIYDGISVEKGSGDLDVTMKAGTWITQENFNVVEAADQNDLLTLTDPGVGQYAYAWVIGAHKFEETDPKPSPDYLLVEGTPVALAAAATIPNDTAIRVAVEAVNSKYDDDANGEAEDKYITKLALIRIQKDSGSVVTATYSRGETWLDNRTLTVYGATEESEFRSGEYYGWDGLKRALDRAEALAALSLGQNQIPIQIDGEILTSDEIVEVPSCVRLQGLGQKARIVNNESGGTLAVRGVTIIWDTVNDTILTPSTVGPTTPPAGFVSRSFQVDSANYPSILTDLQQRKLCRGDTILLRDANAVVDYEATFVQATASDTFECFVETQFNTDGNPGTLTFDILKTRVAINDIEVDRDVSGDGRLIIQQAESCSFERIKTRDLQIGDVQFCHFGLVEVKNLGTITGIGAALMSPNNNYLEHLIVDARTSGLTFSTGTTFGHIDRLTYISPAALGMTLAFQDCTFGTIEAKGDTSTGISLTQGGNQAKLVKASGDITISGSGRWNIDKIKTQDNGTFTFAGFGPNIVGFADVGATGSVVYSGSGDDPTNIVMFSNNDEDRPQVAEHHNEDRNLRLMSDALISWDAGTGVLSWDDVLRFDIPWQPLGYSEVAVGNDTLGTDGDRLFIDIDRDAAGVVPATTTVRAKASADSDRFEKDRVNIAVRFGTDIYMFDGTKIEDGQSIKLGQTPPPDGSVTYQKLASSLGGTPAANADPLLFWRKFMRSHAVPNEDNEGWDDEFTFTNDGLVTFTYTASTGVVQFSSAVDLSAVETAFNAGVPLWIHFRSAQGTGTRQKEQILAVDDSGDNVTIASGLSVTVGSGNKWNGAIGTGAALVTNDDLVTFTYTPLGANKGRIDYNSGLTFNNSMVREGHIFTDSSGNEFRITAVDNSGNGDWIEIFAGLYGASGTSSPNVAQVDTSTPIDKSHGSLKEFNNPFKLEFADLKVHAGVEFVPIDMIGDVADGRRDGNITYNRSTPSGDVTAEGMQRCHIIPFDPRISCLVDRRDYRQIGSVPGAASTAFHQSTMGNNGMMVVEVTAVCTGCILVNNGSETAPLTSSNVEVDGVAVAFNSALVDTDPENVYNIAQTRYQPVMLDTGLEPEFMRLPFGIHHFRWEVHQDDFIERAAIGVLILGEFPTDDVGQIYITESPGTLVHKGGVRKYTSPVSRVLVPTPSAAFAKGLRAIRYIDNAGAKQWATREIRSFSSTGDFAASSPSLSNVSNIGLWNPGDLIIARNTGGEKFLARIVSISGTTITMSHDWPHAAVNLTFYYYGRSFNTEVQPDSGTAANLYAHIRSEEEPVMVHNNLHEFADTGNAMVDSAGVFGEETVTTLNSLGVRLSDTMTGIAADGPARYKHGGGMRLFSVSGDFIRIGFVGTGISIRMEYGSGTIVRLDGDRSTGAVEGIPLGTLPDPASNPDQSHGTYICGELPYGFHLIEIEYDGVTDVSIYGFTVFGPKKPEITDKDAFELWDSNVLANPETRFAGSTSLQLVDSTDTTKLGTIQQGCREVFGAGPPTDDVLRDFLYSGSGSLDQAVFNQLLDTAGGGSTAASEVYFLVIGEEFTLTTGLITLSGGQIDFAFQSKGGAFAAPSTMTEATHGYTATGPDSVTVDDSVNGQRHRWVFNKRVITILRVTMSVIAQTIDFDAVESACGLHNHRAKAPVSNDHWMPWQLGGLDVRNLSPFDHDKIEGGVELAQSFGHHTPGSGTATERPFYFYSKGGLVEVQVTCEVQHNTLTNHIMEINIDGVSELSDVTHRVPVAGNDDVLHMHVTLYLHPGFHVARLQSSVPANTDMRRQVWSARNLRTDSNRLPQHGLGRPTLGPSTKDMI